MSAQAAAPSPPAPFLDVRATNVAYGDLQVLWDVDLCVRSGEFVCVIGSNGAGKTTLLHTIAGLLKPRSGWITLQARRIESLPAHVICELGIALVPEGGQLFPEMTVLENLQVGAHRPQARKSFARNLERAWALFPRLRDRAQQLAGTLSGGERQMLAISRALMSEPRLLMLDEPSLAVAPAVVDQLFDTLASLRGEGLTILLVEQNVQRALEVADRAYVLETGHIVREAPARALVEDPDVRRHFLGI
jgi:branched-chain amino acid transport system ATP-binding protein